MEIINQRGATKQSEIGDRHVRATPICRREMGSRSAFWLLYFSEYEISSASLVSKENKTAYVKIYSHALEPVDGVNNPVLRKNFRGRLFFHTILAG